MGLKDMLTKPPISKNQVMSACVWKNAAVKTGWSGGERKNAAVKSGWGSLLLVKRSSESLAYDMKLFIVQLHLTLLVSYLPAHCPAPTLPTPCT